MTVENASNDRLVYGILEYWRAEARENRPMEPQMREL